MEHKSLVKSFSRDLAYSVAGLVLMNATIQILVYPVLQAKMGADVFGVVLSLFSVISIIAASFATGANYSRMVVASTEDEVRGDYTVFMAFVCAGGAIVAVIATFIMGFSSVPELIGFVALMVATLLRYYGDVNFRLALDYRGFFFYYLVISIGYGVGIGILAIPGSPLSLVDFWWLSLLLGEIAAFVYVRVKGDIYTPPYFKRSEQFSSHVRSMMALSLAYLLSAIVMNADRLLILAFVGSAEVTIFYTASLVGKTVALLTGPLNGVVIGYLTKKGGRVSKTLLTRIALGLLGAGVVLSALTVGMSYILIYLLYPNIFETTRQFFIVASVGQVFYFLSESLLVIVLKVASEKYQLILNIVYTIVFFAAAVPAVILGGVWGIAIAILVVNVVRFLAVAAFGLRHAE